MPANLSTVIHAGPGAMTESAPTNEECVDPGDLYLVEHISSSVVESVRISTACTSRRPSTPYLCVNG